MSSAQSSQSIIVVYGGKSGEHEVSLMSAASVLRHLDPKKYRIELVGIDHDGRWYRQPQTVLSDCRAGKDLALRTDQPVVAQLGGGFFYSKTKTQLSELVPLQGEVVFPVLHGTYGEDGTIQGLLDMLGIAYVGSGVLGSSLGMDKEKAKQIWQTEGLPVVPYRVFQSTGPDEVPGFSKIEDLWRIWSSALGTTLFVKPARAGSSVGISRAGSAKELETALRAALRFDHKLIIEAAVHAREIETSVLGNLNPRSFPPGEVKPNHEFYDYDAKYIDPDGALLLVPAPIPEEVAIRIRDIAVRAYRSAEARGLARVDFFYEEETDRVYLNEINTLPGFTHISMYPKMCEAGGLSYSNLLDELIVLAREEFLRKESLSYDH